MATKQASSERSILHRDGLRSPIARAIFALALVLLLGVAFPAEGAFFRIGTHVGTLRQASVHGILAVGLVPVILTGGIDLAVGSILGLIAVVVAKTVMHLGYSSTLGVLAGLVMGGLCGATSGALVSFMRLQPFIATLAMMVFARGLAKTLSGGMKVATAVAGPDGIIMKFVGIDALPHEGVAYVEQGLLDVTFQYPTGGKEAIELAMKILHGEKPPKTITLGSRMFTKENVKQGGTAIE